VEVVRRFGSTVYYGDTSRLDLLRAARVDKARAFVLAIEDIEVSMRTARVVRSHFPRLDIYARARNRRHAHLLRDLGVKVIVRETFASSLELADNVLQGIGVSREDARAAVKAFRRHDEKTLDRQHAFYRNEEKLIQSRFEAAAELENLMESDRGAEKKRSKGARSASESEEA
jgi:glutathione-regulated potassium-efflux system ancillary protein KefC/glutathione-regulated potassium-efflux system protein KefB